MAIVISATNFCRRCQVMNKWRKWCHILTRRIEAPSYPNDGNESKKASNCNTISVFWSSVCDVIRIEACCLSVCLLLSETQRVQIVVVFFTLLFEGFFHTTFRCENLIYSFVHVCVLSASSYRVCPPQRRRKRMRRRASRNPFWLLENRWVLERHTRHPKPGNIAWCALTIYVDSLTAQQWHIQCVLSFCDVCLLWKCLQ